MTIERAELVGQLNISELDTEWKAASSEVQAEYVKSKRKTLGLIIGCGILISILIIVMALSRGSGKVPSDSGDTMHAVAAGMVIFAIYLIALVFALLKYRKNVSAKVFYKKVVLIKVFRVKHGKSVTFGELCPDGGFRFVNAGFTYDCAAFADTPQCGDCAIVSKVGDNYTNITTYGMNTNLFSKETSEATLQKVDERRFEHGDDHRSVEFFMKKSAMGFDMLAIVHRLDISDDKPVAVLDKYYSEKLNVEEAENHGAFAEFADRIVKMIEAQMAELTVNE